VVDREALDSRERDDICGELPPLEEKFKPGLASTALRQHLREDVRIHGIITDGGMAPNVVPEYSAANFMLRCRDRRYLSEVVMEKVREVAEGAALMSGAQLELEPYYPLYENVLPNGVLAEAFRTNAGAVGMRLDEPIPGRRGSGASTDFGNISQILPAFELRYAVSRDPVPSHSRQMCETAITEMALSSAIDVAKILSLTANDILRDAVLLKQAQAEFARCGGLQLTRPFIIQHAPRLDNLSIHYMEEGFQNADQFP
jgi:metal-dependent amidase/aminoacylase/carboxypeptidase family protein